MDVCNSKVFTPTVRLKRWSGKQVFLQSGQLLGGWGRCHWHTLRLHGKTCLPLHLFSRTVGVNTFELQTSITLHKDTEWCHDTIDVTTGRYERQLLDKTAWIVPGTPEDGASGRWQNSSATSTTGKADLGM